MAKRKTPFRRNTLQHIPEEVASAYIAKDKEKNPLPDFLQEMMQKNDQREQGLDKKELRQTMKVSISDLLSSQDLKEVFDSFKKHEHEFETYLRPIMREVVAESTFKHGEINEDEYIEQDEKCWSDARTWGFLHKSICKENKVFE